jgi:hypothetical protein
MSLSMANKLEREKQNLSVYHIMWGKSHLLDRSYAIPHTETETNSTDWCQHRTKTTRDTYRQCYVIVALQ